MHNDKNRYDLPRTRSQSFEAALTKPKNTHFQVGQLVYAHKGRTVPCWFPGVVEANTKKIRNSFTEAQKEIHKLSKQ